MTEIRWERLDGDWAIEAHNLAKRFGRQAALRGLTLRVPRGGVHGLLGPNGSGKTTLIRVLLGLVRAQAGDVRVLGRDIPRQLPETIDSIGAIVESPKFAPRLSGRQNLEVLALSIGVSRRRVTEVLLEVGLGNDAEREFQSYSLGMRQRLAIAATLLKSPELLIFDEPTNGLDPMGIHDIRDTMRALVAAGRTVLLSSHILAEIEQVADSVSIIARGQVVAEGPIDAFLADGDAYLWVGIGQVVEAADVLRAAGFLVEGRAGGLEVRGRQARPVPEEVAAALGMKGLWPRELREQRRTLEGVFLELTAGRDLTAMQGLRRAG